jgi:diacylglycerol kinase (ATP)
MTNPWLAIVNPKAGPRRSDRRLHAIADRLRRELDAQVVFTQRPGHAMQLAAESTPSQGIAAFGGDGTIAEVVNGMSIKDQRLLVLAGGTGNGLARDLGLMSIKASLAAAQANRIRRIDLVRVTFRAKGQSNSRLEISTASLGYAAEVVALSHRYLKWLGPFFYPLAATVQAGRQKSFPLSVFLGQQQTQVTVSNVMVNNTRHAGNFSAFRRSRLDDGKLEVFLARAGPVTQMLHNLAVLSKTYFYTTAREFETKQIRFTMPVSSRLMIDGELWEDVSEAQFEVLPGALKCVV